MTDPKKILCTMVCLLLLIPLSACMDQDPFGLSKRTINGRYYLESYEFGYLLKKDGVPDYNGFGYLDGYILELGWDESKLYIKSRPIDDDYPDGWFILDLNKDKFIGDKLSEEEFKKKYPNAATYPAKIAFSKLGSDWQDLLGITTTKKVIKAISDE
jgi:hypothetical protein